LSAVNEKTSLNIADKFVHLDRPKTNLFKKEAKHERHFRKELLILKEFPSTFQQKFKNKNYYFESFSLKYAQSFVALRFVGFFNFE
jgi:hypothetical protein